MIENKNVKTVAKEEKEEIEMKKVIITTDIRKGVIYEVINGTHKFAPNATVTGIIPVGTKVATEPQKQAAAMAYAAQLNSYKDVEFDILNNKVVTGGYIVRSVLAKKLVALGFTVVTELSVEETEKDKTVITVHLGEGYFTLSNGTKGDNYLYGGSVRLPIYGSIAETGLQDNQNRIKDMVLLNLGFSGENVKGTCYAFTYAASKQHAREIFEIALSEKYGVKITSYFDKEMKKGGIYSVRELLEQNKIQLKEAERVTKNAVKQNRPLETAAAIAERTANAANVAVFTAELAQRDAKIATLEAAVTELQKVVAELKKAVTPVTPVAPEPEDNPEPKDPPPETTPVKDETKDEDWGDLDDISTPGYHEDSMMNPNAKLPIEEPVQEKQDDVSNDKEQAVPEETVKEQNAQEEPAKKYEINTDDIVLTPEVSELIASFLAFDDISMPSKSVLDYEGALRKYEEERDRRYVLLIAHTRALGCSLEELKAAIVKKFRPQGLKISGIGVKDSKMYVRASKCGPGGLAWYEIVNDNNVKILKDSFLKLKNSVK